VRATANLSPEPFSNWALSLFEDGVAILGAVLAVIAPVLILIVIGIFLLFFFWFVPKVLRDLRRMFRATRSFFSGKGFRDATGKA
jgi:uncharacterized membrane protein (DUF106 family)